MKSLLLTLILFFTAPVYSKTILVTGGAGYIGTQTCKALKEAGFHPIAYDNLSTGTDIGFKWGTLVKGDITDRKKLAEVIDRYQPIALIHFAAYKSVIESVSDPAKYYLNNLCGSLILLDVMREKGLKKIIFSSSSSVYGDSETLTPAKENDLCAPISPYGTSKWMVEKIIQDFQSAYGLQSVILRYFNVAGADLSNECGNRMTTPQNLIPLVLQIAMEKRKELEIYGGDFPTRDGTAIRDYIHVVDLADAHVRALRYLLDGKPSAIINLGTGKGASVKEVVDVVESVTGKTIPLKQASRRKGEPCFATSDPGLAKELLGWEPTNSDLKTILETEWKWTQFLEKDKS